MEHHLIYASHAKEGLGLKELQAILNAAEIFNEQNNITGALAILKELCEKDSYE